MAMLEPLDKNDAPEEARGPMQTAEDAFGFVPNLIGVMAHAPPVAEGYLALGGLLEKTSFSGVEQQLLLLAISVENGCDYCVAAHTGGAMQAGADDEVIQALRAGDPLPDDRLAALTTFTRAVVRERGWVDDEQVEAFLHAGFGEEQILEVILAVSMKTLSNYVNHVAETPLDEALEPLAWSRPEGVGAAAD